MGTIEQSKRHTAITILDNESSIIEDTYLLAALITFDPTITYCPVCNEHGEVSFRVHGRIADSMGRYYAGETAPLQTYIGNLKALRSAIFAMKRSQMRRCR